MKPLLTLLCAVSLTSASFAAQSAPVNDSSRVVAELLRMAQEHNATGDVEMARALTEAASRLMGGQNEAGPAAPPAFAGERMALTFAGERMPLTALAQDGSGEVRMRFAPALEQIELADATEPAELAELAELGYLSGQVIDARGVPVEGAFVVDLVPLQDDLHASLMAIREELHALRAEVGALRAQIAGRNGNGQFRGGMMGPGPNGEMPREGFMLHAPAQAAQGFYFQQGAQPGLPANGFFLPQGGQQAPDAAPNGVWEWRASPHDAPPAPESGPGGAGGGSADAQRWHEQARAEAMATRQAHTELQDAHRAALRAFHAAAAGLQPPPPPPAAPRSGDDNANPHNLR